VNAVASPSLARRAAAAFVLSLMFVGAFVLWIGIPAVVLWGLARLTKDAAQHLVLGLLLVPVAMIAFVPLLGLLNYAYLRLSGVAIPDDRDDRWRPTLSGPLDRILRISAGLCFLAFLAWLIFASGVAPPGAGAW
jgi:Na+/phosphate symporter